MYSETKKINKIIDAGARSGLTEKQFFEQEIANWKRSTIRTDMITGEDYYCGKHDILSRKRTAIGKDGALQEVHNLPNNKIVDNQYAKMVDQKVNYLLGKPVVFNTENKQYNEALKTIFDNSFSRTLKNLGEDCLNGGIAWLYPYYNEDGELCFKKFESFEILPFWKDAEHTVLDCAIRLYEVDGYEGATLKTFEKVEVYSKDGIGRYELQNGKLVPDVDNPSSSHMVVITADGSEQGHNWTKIPLIPFKFNNKEIPLINRVKSLQDGINLLVSDFQNNMQEDARNTILVIENFGGEDLNEFRHNLTTYGAVKVTTIEGMRGGVSTLKIDVNADNYKSILEVLKKALIENARGFDAKDDRLSNNPNQMNIQSMYSDIDLDANGMETEFKASFDELLWFVNQHLANTWQGNFDNEKVEIIFNRDILINESESIDNCQKSEGIISQKTIVSQHPWINDVDLELKQIRQDESQQDGIADLHKHQVNNNDES